MDLGLHPINKPAALASYSLPDLEAVVTGRKRSLFARDMEERSDALAEGLRRRRVLIVGGGGTIGAMTTRLAIDYQPAALHVVDISENYLAELVRDLRSRPSGLFGTDFRTLPIDYGSPIMRRVLEDVEPYDVVLNFAALKHVRSEKDIYSLLQMFDTNIVRHIRFKEWLASNGHCRAYFAVSTDKAANPASLMGASKRLMEDVVFSTAVDRALSTTSARFANVAFSNGSLFESFLHRLERRQPLAVPRGTQRYFLSQREAGELCLLAALAVPDRHVAFPKLDPRLELQDLDQIAARILATLGFAAEFVEDEEYARRDVESFTRRGRWPVVLTPLDTSGEKPYEEFVGEGEAETDIGLNGLSALRHCPTRAREEGFFERLSLLVDNPSAVRDRAEIVASVEQVLASFRHVDTGRNLDQRL